MALGVCSGRYWGLMQRNPGDLVDAPREERTTVRAFDVAQAKAFLAAVKGDALEPRYHEHLTSSRTVGSRLSLAPAMRAGHPSDTEVLLHARWLGRWR